LRLCNGLCDLGRTTAAPPSVADKNVKTSD
jgi:hypothetical protein